MKYVEQIKSVVLLFLVLLSVTLTFLIWNYKPDYKFIDETPGEQITIGEKKKVKDVLKPYRLLYRQEDLYKGTVSTAAIDDLYNVFSTWEAQDVTLINNNLSADKLNEMLRVNDRMTLFFADKIPLQSFASILNFKDRELPDTSFDRLILDWTNIKSKNQLQLLFVNTEKRTLYRSYVTVWNERQFELTVLAVTKNYNDYIEVARTNAESLYVIEDGIESVKYEYFIDDLSPELFKEVLFTDPSIVQRNIESVQSEKYSDNWSFMTVDTQSKILNYVYPAAESLSAISSSELLHDSMDFLNEHGGLTGDYRLAAISPSKHVTEYQLYLQGFPVHSNMALTRITTTWGDNRIFRYRRPYYSLDDHITSEKTIKELPSGIEMIEYIKNNPDFSLNKIDEMVVGYYLMQNQNLLLFTLEPSWFVIEGNVWTRITLDRLGGVNYGLE